MAVTGNNNNDRETSISRGESANPAAVASQRPPSDANLIRSPITEHAQGSLTAQQRSDARLVEAIKNARSTSISADVDKIREFYNDFTQNKVKTTRVKLFK
jgi:hypothetical protein